MRMVQSFVNGITRFNDLVGRWISYLIYGIFAFLILEVFFRYFLNAPTVWTNELGQMLFAVYTIMAGGYIMAHREHVNVDLFYSTLSRRTRAVVDVFTSALFFIFTLALLYFGSSMAWDSIQSMETSFSAWNPPVWPIKAAIPLGVFLLLLQGLAKLFQDIAIVVAGGRDDDQSTQRGVHP